MISLQQFRIHLYTIFPFMSKSPSYFDVVHKGIVYEVHVIKTDKEPELRRKRAAKADQSKILPINAEECVACGSMKFNDVCMNRDCDE